MVATSGRDRYRRGTGTDVNQVAGLAKRLGEDTLLELKDIVLRGSNVKR